MAIIGQRTYIDPMTGQVQYLDDPMTGLPWNDPYFNYGGYHPQTAPPLQQPQQPVPATQGPALPEGWEQDPMAHLLGGGGFDPWAAGWFSEGPDQSFYGDAVPDIQQRNFTVPPGWENWYNQSFGTASPLPDTPFTTAEPLQMAEQNRLAARGWGQTMDQDLVNAANRYQNLEGSFMDWGLFGPGGYNDILGGRGGFGQEERDNILQQDMLRNALASGAELDSLQLQPHEIQQITGSPYAARDIFAGQRSQLESMQGETEKRQREAFGDQGYLEGALKSAVDPNALRVAPGYYDDIQGIIGDTAQGYADIIDPNYLGLSEDFNRNYQFSDRDRQDIVDQAGRTVGAGRQARQDALERRAAAHGNSSPLALQAAISRNQVLGDIAASDAMTDARIRAGQVGRDVSRGRETMRLDTERDIADRSMQATQDLSNRGLQQANAYEQMRQGTERDLSNRYMDVGSQVGQTRLATERGIGQAQQDLGRYGAGYVTDLTQQGERDAVNRAGDVATRRQDAGRYGIDARFQQYYPASQALSSRYGNIYSQKKAEEAEGRGYLSGQQQRAQEGGTVGRQQRIQAGATHLQGINQPVSAALAAKSAPGFWDQFGAGVIGAAPNLLDAFNRSRGSGSRPSGGSPGGSGGSFRTPPFVGG